MTTYSLDGYNDRLLSYKELCLSKTSDKFTIVTNYIYNDVLNEERLNDLCKISSSNAADADFSIIILIRLLYLSNKESKHHDLVCSKIDAALSTYSFWPSTVENMVRMDDFCFWSENHILMLLSSYHLYHQWLKKHRPIDCVSCDNATATPNNNMASLEEKLLISYLNGHVEMNGVYEVLSHVYLPFSFSSLLNLYDFSDDMLISHHAKSIADIITEQLLLCTTSSGVCSFSASNRAFKRTRLHAFGHNVNQLTLLITGKSPDSVHPSQLSDFLLTTKWRPSDKTIERFEFSGFIQVKMNHTIKDIKNTYVIEADVNPIELMPFYWSAGLITHPDYIGSTKQYQSKKKQKHNMMLWPLRFTGVESILNHYTHFSCGQCYLGNILNVYKDGNVCLSSFECFNDRCMNFQQLPWCLNFNSIPVWSQAGVGGESVAKFDVINTHSPCIKQVNNVLVLSYMTPASLRTVVMSRLFDHKVRFFWPSSYFDEEKCTTKAKKIRSVFNTRGNNKMRWDKGSWWIARSGVYYVGISCTQETYVSVTATADTMSQRKKDEIEYSIPRKVCKELNHSWIVLLGNTKDYATIEDFIDRKCKSVKYIEYGGGSGNNLIYKLSVTIDDNLITETILSI